MNEFDKQEFWGALTRLYDTSVALRDSIIALKDVSEAHEKRLDRQEVITQAILEELKQIQGMFAQLSPVSVKVSDASEIAVAAAEFLLEGMYAHKRLSRSEERGFSAQEKSQRKQERMDQEREHDEFQEQRRTRRGFN